MKSKLKDIINPTFISGNYEYWNNEYVDDVTKVYVDDNEKLTIEETHKRLDNMDISVIETYLREKKLKKIW
jgi:hypothetical protein